ncbi:hypothetical protein OIU84_017315 [Salix udensis]|uniref:Uncharacterized protein n=1 Tax=Salix udensis TaxID=889485 RepID=A0AAD6L1M1_9ROSI|nr:hypothetical protein OIU84_017315 [Salix udensis]
MLGCDLKQENGDRVIFAASKCSSYFDTGHKQETIDNIVAMPSSRNVASAPRRRVIGFEMPSAELLAATAKLTEAQAELRFFHEMVSAVDTFFCKTL